MQRFPLFVLTLGLMAPAHAGDRLSEADIQAAVSLMEQARLPAVVEAPRSATNAHYVSPFSADGELLPWVTKASEAPVRRSFGPRSRRVAQTMSSLEERLGGWETIRRQSELSFHTVDELAVHMHSRHADHPDYAEALAVTVALYPELEYRYAAAVHNASGMQATAQSREQSIAATPKPAFAATTFTSYEQVKPSLAQMTATVPPDLSALTATVALETPSDDSVQLLTQNVDLSEQPAETLMADNKLAEAAAVKVAERVQPEPAEATAVDSEPYASEIERIMRPVRLAQAGLESADVLTQPVPVQQSGQVKTVEQRLAVLMERRARGEMSGEQYLAERRRIIYG